MYDPIAIVPCAEYVVSPTRCAENSDPTSKKRQDSVP